MNNENINSKSLLDKIVFFIVKVNNDDIFALGAQLAYYLMLSFFPFLLFLLTIVGFSRLNTSEILGGLSTILPISVYGLIETTVVEVVETQNAGLLGASLILTIWSASSGFRAVIKGLNKAYDIKEKRTFIKRVIVGIIFTLALVLVIMLTLAMLVFGEILGEHLLKIVPFKEIIKSIWNISRYLIVVFMMVLIFASIYRYTPAKKFHGEKFILVR